MDHKYQEAFERAKELHEAGNAFTKSQMEIVFPELKESEDERIRKAIILSLKYSKMSADGFSVDKMVAWLEKQKPAEWSEEDDGLMEMAIGAVEEYYGDSNPITEPIVNMLKSLRPQPRWKPSEEQMKALLSKLPVVKGSGDKVQDILESLYNDLKKL